MRFWTHLSCLWGISHDAVWQGRSGWAKMADFEEQLSDEEKVIDNQFMLSGWSSLLCFWDMYDLYIDMNVS